MPESAFSIFVRPQKAMVMSSSLWMICSARGTLIGRSFLYGLGAYGQAGVTRALQIIHKELDITMAFCGRTNIENVDSGILLPGTF